MVRYDPPAECHSCGVGIYDEDGAHTGFQWACTDGFTFCDELCEQDFYEGEADRLMEREADMKNEERAIDDYLEGVYDD